ncbi:MAG: deoxyribodipyrimidine photo-lyase [Rhizomicrobium sp.]
MSHHKPEMKPVIWWFRQDFQFADNPALTAAIATGQPALCIPLSMTKPLDDGEPVGHPDGGFIIICRDLPRVLKKSVERSFCARGPAVAVLSRLTREVAGIVDNRQDAIPRRDDRGVVSGEASGS